MYARTTTLDAQPSSIDAGIAEIRDTVIPALDGMTGYVGLSLLVDRESGRCIATSAWESEENLHDSGEAIREVRNRAAEAFGGRAEVAEWEVAAMHREHQAGAGATVRVTWVQVSPDQIDRGIDVFKTSVLPGLETHEGYCSASLFVDRTSGRAVSSAVYDNLAALEHNQGQIDQLKASASRDAEAEILDERDFELTIHQLRVPEMA